MQQLNKDEIKNSLDNLDGWFYLNNSIEKEYTLKTFADAIALIVKIGIEAEKIDHHPDLLLHSWNKVKVILSTHSQGGVTTKDFKLAQTIDEIRK
ncbi:MAG: 4a-hydroxytetrahydrobiopterin dehydratase [Melioribacter sp.]|nr:4a-hydroxytetrahydrobiopterin dehydratase [Melioribacter sp.]